MNQIGCVDRCVERVACGDDGGEKEERMKPRDFTDYTTLFLFRKKKTCAKRKNNLKTKT